MYVRSALSSLALVLCHGAFAQSTILQFNGASAGDNLGRAIAAVGDLDGDGVTDLAIGADGEDTVAQDAGEVVLVSGATGSVLFTLRGDSIGDFFGAAVAAAGDVNGDGIGDVVVGSYGDDPSNLLDAGSASVFSGADGSLIWKFLGDGVEDRVGFSVSGAGDVDADGFADVVVGGWSDDATGADAGEAVVYSGRTGAVLWRFGGQQPGDFAGFSVAGGGDVNGDGFDDVVVGAPGADAGGDRAGTAWVYSGQTGALLWSLDGLSAVEFSGISVAMVGDLDGDGGDDIGVGVPFGDDGGVDFGSVRLFSGRTGNLIRAVSGVVGSSLFGYSVAGGADVDGDGRPDVVVGAVVDSSFAPVAGTAFVFSGANGALLGSMGGAAPADAFGASVDLADMDGDGFADVLVGAVFADSNGIDSGSVSLIDLGFIGQPPRADRVGVPCLGSNGHLPRSEFEGRTALGAALGISLRGAIPNTIVTLNIGRPASLDLSPIGMVGCTAYASTDGFILPAATNAFGMAAFGGFNVPQDVTLLGKPIVSQWVIVDATANAAGHVTSDAIQFRFGR